MVYKKVFKGEDYNMQPFVLQQALSLLCVEKQRAHQSLLSQSRPVQSLLNTVGAVFAVSNFF